MVKNSQRALIIVLLCIFLTISVSAGEGQCPHQEDTNKNEPHTCLLHNITSDENQKDFFDYIILDVVKDVFSNILRTF